MLRLIEIPGEREFVARLYAFLIDNGIRRIRQYLVLEETLDASFVAEGDDLGVLRFLVDDGFALLVADDDVLLVALRLIRSHSNSQTRCWGRSCSAAFP